MYMYAGHFVGLADKFVQTGNNEIIIHQTTLFRQTNKIKMTAFPQIVFKICSLEMNLHVHA